MTHVTEVLACDPQPTWFFRCSCGVNTANQQDATFGDRGEEIQKALAAEHVATAEQA